MATPMRPSQGSIMPLFSNGGCVGVFASTSARRSGSLIRWMCVRGIGTACRPSSSILLVPRHFSLLPHHVLSFVPHFFFCISSLSALLFCHRLVLLIVHFYPSLRRSSFSILVILGSTPFSVTLFPLRAQPFFFHTHLLDIHRIW
jgi:hypothetical protein